MKRLLIIFAAVPLLSALGAKDKPGRFERNSARTERTVGRSEKESSTATPAGQGFEAFRYVRTRNIFDPTRRGPRTEAPASASAGASAPRRVRSLSLTGTMVTAGKTLAFFGGAESRVIGVGESVANFKVTKIVPAQVSLEHDGKALQLEVGKQITLEEAGGGGSEAPPVVEAAAPETPTSVPGVPTAPASGDKNEVLRRLMERRAKEEGR